MDYNEVLAQARTCMGPYCKACPVCNGLGCRNTVPGPGAKGLGTGFIRNYQKWQELCLNMDTICENGPADSTFDFFGTKLVAPVMAAPVGAMKLHYGDKYDDLTYNDLLVSSCAKSGVLAFTGDGTNAAVMDGALAAISAAGGMGVPTVKPWDRDTVFAKLEQVRKADPVAIAMDIDAAGLPFLQNLTPPAGSKTVPELREIIDYAKKPFIIKGIMTVKGARKALEAGASGIVVSNHGGRGAARHRRRGGRPDEDLRRRRHPHGSGRTEGAGAGRGRRADRPPVRDDGLRRRRRGCGRLCPQAHRRAARRHGDVRRPLAERDHPRDCF